jgi:hypothetical protein
MIHADGKDKIIQPFAIARAMGIRTIAVFDSDGHKYAPVAGEDPTTAAVRHRPMHVRDNNAILQLAGIQTPAPFPADTLFSDSVVMWHSEITKIVEEDIGDNDWHRFREQANQELGQPGGLQKNGMHIALAMANAWEAGKRSPHLARLCEHILQLGPPTPATMQPARAATAVPPEVTPTLEDARPN